MEKQDWKGKELDKDLLVNGNKVYSPETCIFLTKKVNSFIIDTGKSLSGNLTGTSRSKVSGLFVAQCSHPITRKMVRIGAYEKEADAHAAWKRKKVEFINLVTKDDFIASMLKSRFA
jgi:hypothetical protein